MATQTASSASASLGVPPCAPPGAAPAIPIASSVAPGRLVLGMVGFAIVALEAVIALLEVVPPSSFTRSAFLLIEVLGVGLIAVGLTGLRSALAYVAGGAHAAAALVLSSNLLVPALGVDSQTPVYLQAFVFNGLGVLAAASTAAACLANAQKLGPLRIPTALPWLVLVVVLGRMARVALWYLLRSPDLPSAEDDAWFRTMYLVTLLAACVATGLLLFIANVRAHDPSPRD
jgi:hypothetical protein